MFLGASGCNSFAVLCKSSRQKLLANHINQTTVALTFKETNLQEIAQGCRVEKVIKYVQQIWGTFAFYATTCSRFLVGGEGTSLSV